MNQVIRPAPVRKSIQVAVPPARAFEVFTRRMGAWWLPGHSIAPSGQADVVIEEREGGRWYEIGKAGEQCDWGHVLAWEPPARLVLAWRLSPDFAYDPALHTEVEVRFLAEGGGTRVELEHRGLENYGAAGQEMRGVFDSENGWGGLLAMFAQRIARG